MMKRYSAKSSLETYLAIFFFCGAATVSASVACNETSTCENTLRPGSTCVDGFCTNPFSKGCLNAILGDDYPKIRTCNSQDEPGAVCAPSPLNYEEVRIAPANWESAMFYGWFAYPKIAAPYDALYKANEVGDCRNTDEPCAHFITEVWQNKREFNDSAVEREGNGMVASVGWYTPKFAVEADVSITHYLGLVGDANRQKLADMFKRPMRWIDYCEQISADNCTTKDGVSSRPPADSTESLSFFVQDAYTGHFVMTEKNNCTANPNCTGHLIDYPCTWSAYTAAQIYWNDMPLESDPPNDTTGYTYGEMLQIIDASNATQSPIIVVWWYPDPLPVVYDFVEITLPTTTRECLDNRPDPADRCTASADELHGKQVGSCGYNTHSVEKYFAISFRKRNIEVPIANRSPGPQLARNIHLSDIDLSEVMVDWVNRGVDKWNYDPRAAVCEWVAANYESGLAFKKFIPPGYPRVVHQEAGYSTAFTSFCIIFGVVGSIVSAVAGGASYRFRNKKQIKCAQSFFLYLFSTGFFLVEIGASLYGAVPSAGSCVARWWFVVTGYTLVFVPLLIKISAINKLMKDSMRCRKTNVSKAQVYKIVGAIVFVVMIYLSIWTGIDAPTPQSELVLRTESGNEVDVQVQCESNNAIWELITLGWRGVLICGAAAVAFVSRNIPQAFNESRVVANVAYVSFLFYVFSFLLYLLPDSVLQPSLKNALTSLILTLESLLVIGLYFGTKFYSIYKHEDAKERGSVYTSTGGNTHYAPRTSTVPRFNSMESEPAADYTPRPISRFNSMDSEPTAPVPNSISMPTGNEEICPLCHNFKSVTKTTVAVTEPSNENESESVISTPDGIEDFGQLEINPNDSEDVVKIEEAALMRADDIKTDMLSSLDLPDGNATVETVAVGANSQDGPASNVDVKEIDGGDVVKVEEAALMHSDEIKSNLDLPDGSAKVETAAVGVDVNPTPASNESEEEESAWIPL